MAKQIKYQDEAARAIKAGVDKLANADEIRPLIVQAYDHLLTAETSCNFYWGSRWVHRSFDGMEQTYHLLDTAMAKMQKT